MDEKTVVLETTQGSIEIKIMPDMAPKACENFIKLIEKGYYNGIIFHMVKYAPHHIRRSCIRI